MVEVLLKNRANVNATNLQGLTALRWTDSIGDKEVADLLRKQGAKE